MLQGIFSALGLGTPISEAQGGGATPRTPRKQDDEWRRDRRFECQGTGDAPTPRASRPDHEWIEGCEDLRPREPEPAQLDVPEAKKLTMADLCASGSSSSDALSTTLDSSSGELDNDGSRTDGECSPRQPGLRELSPSDEHSSDHAQSKEPQEVMCWALEEQETELERLERVVNHVLEQLRLEGVELPDNICRMEHSVPMQRSHVYRFGTRQLHLNVREAEAGKLLLIVRTGGGFNDFADFCRRHGRLELARWRQSAMRASMSTPLLREESLSTGLNPRRSAEMFCASLRPSLSKPLIKEEPLGTGSRPRRSTDTVLASVLSSSTPRQTSGGGIPKATTPRSTTPRAVTPRAKTPRATGARSTTPRAITPRANTPRATAARSTTPRSTVPCSTTPRCTTPRTRKPGFEEGRVGSTSPRGVQKTESASLLDQARASRMRSCEFLEQARASRVRSCKR